MLAHQAFQVCDFFAGDGNVGKTAKFGMVACAQLDVDYGKKTTRVHKQNAFDLLQPSGLAFLAWFKICSFFMEDPSRNIFIHYLSQICSCSLGSCKVGYLGAAEW